MPGAWFTGLLQCALVFGLWLAVAPGSYGQAIVNPAGIPLGRMDFNTFTDMTNANAASLQITANFTFNGNANAQNFITTMFPQGLTYLQTVTFNFNSGNQQRIFRRNDTGHMGDSLIGTFPDPPQNGYLLSDNTTLLAGDNTPWYQLITPQAGATQPPDQASFGNNQFRDTPSIPFGAANGIDGLTNLLANQDGSINFETALVGVTGIPADLNNGPYGACFLMDFTWGFSFHALGGNNYTTTLDTPSFHNVNASQAFIQAFDRQGPNGPAEWLVTFTPEPA